MLHYYVQELPIKQDMSGDLSVWWSILEFS